MWDKRENNMMYRDQNVKSYSVGSDNPFIPNMRFPPPNNGSGGHFFVEASRKRKSLDIDSVHGGVSAGFLGNVGGNMGHSLQRDYTFQYNVSLPPPVDSQMLFNHNPDHANPGNAESQYGASTMDNSLPATERGDGNVKMASFGNAGTFNRNEPSFPVRALHEIREHRDSKHVVCDIANRYEPIKFASHYRQNSGVMEMSQPQAAFRLDDGKTSGLGDNSVPSDPYLYHCSLPLNDTSHLSLSNFRVLNENFRADPRFNRNGLREEKEYGQVTRLEGDRNISISRMNSTQTSGFNEGGEAYEFYEYHNNKIRPGSYINNNNFGSQLNLREVSGPPTSRMLVQTESSAKEGCLDHVSRGFETKLLERTEEGSNTENAGHSLAEATPHISGNSVVKRPVVPEDEQPMHMEESNQLLSGKVSPLIAEKLWDGSLQLSTSTMVSALAFFKSGEKAPNMKWSEHIEIKGKVRLQAFEKFIQELPYSRKRTLMVVSLCWKPGSSEAGLAGMKEVAKGYKDTHRVGFAHITPGFDIYVCPRSEAIITILAKYGFFKGMAAVDDDQDSLIGCVIWRRVQNTSNPVPKISEKKKTGNSPDSSVHDIKSPITQVDESGSKQETTSSPLISKVLEDKVIQVQPPAAQKLDSTSLHESMKNNEIPTSRVVESRQQTNTEFSDGSRNVTNLNSSPPPGFATSSSLDSSFMRTQLPTPQNLDSSYGLNPMQSNSKPELARPAFPAPPSLPPDILQRIVQFNRDAHKAPTEGIPKGGTSFKLPEEPKKHGMGSKADDNDDADLPEFDFDSAYGVQKAPEIRFPDERNVKPLPFDQQVTFNGMKNEKWPTPYPVPQPAPITPTSNASNVPCRTSTHEGSSKFEKPDSSFPKKSRWDDDDDDDMPEWCPPNLENEDLPKSSMGTSTLENAKELPSTSSSMTALRPLPPQSQSFPHGHHPGIVHNRPPLLPTPTNFMRPPVANFSANPPNSEFNWKWKRQ